MKNTLYTLILIISAATTCSATALAWTGERADNGDEIEVIHYDHRGIGEGDVEYYDANGNYRTGYLDMFPGGSGEITDDATGETFEVEME